MGLAALLSAVTTFLLIQLLWLCSTIHTIYRQNCGSQRPEHRSLRGYLKSTSFVYLVSFSLAYFFSLILTGLALNDHKFFWTPHLGWNIFMVIIGTFAAIGFLSFYLFIIGRLFYTFENTTYGISERTRNVYIALSVIMCILLLIYLSSYFLYRPWLRWILPVAITAVALNLGVAISLTAQFTSKLIQCASYRRESVCSPEENALSPHQEALLVVAARHCALSCVGISVNVFIPIAISFYVWVYEHNIGTYLLTVAVCFALHSVEMISVLFSFAYNKQYYYRFCKPCDKGCNMLLHDVAEKRLDDQEKEKEFGQPMELRSASNSPRSPAMVADYSADMTHSQQPVATPTTP
mmetsp:Transcript_29009/g.45970  ORF Transcript_29009/g.45970 Transcript_29009/m.45970 type:complete len:351 (-) Transcript_29009:34-1086(-)